MTLQTGGIAFDCADPTKLAGFWAAATEREVDGSSNDEFALVGRPGKAGAVPPMLFVRVPEPKSAKNRPRE
ncbi:VOC family protein [Pseudonocardia benzenivorans]|uniref:VOC family protein n=1 Tax=Pseudonocardia benzenivorans TaxID=228005 RepID=A0ABW3VJ75_9PSEU